MGESSPLGCGIIGAGFMGKTYARVIRDHVEGATLVAVAEGSVDALITRDDIDVVCIASPHAVHGEQALAALNGGKHVLIDKPMATTVEACDAILEACTRNKVRCEITFSQRQRICNIETKRILDSGEIGRMCHMRNVQVVPDGMKTTPAWQLESENVGILLGHAIHNIDQVRWFSGQEVAKVFGKVGSFDSKYAVDSTSDLLLTLEDGTVCNVFCTFEMPAPGIPRTGGATQIICERGIIDSDWYGELRVSRNGAPYEVVATQPAIDWAGLGFLDPVRLETYAAVIQPMVDGILAGDTTSVSAFDGRQSVAIALAAYESSRTGQEVQP